MGFCDSFNRDMVFLEKFYINLYKLVILIKGMEEFAGPFAGNLKETFIKRLNKEDLEKITKGFVTLGIPSLHRSEPGLVRDMRIGYYKGKGDYDASHTPECVEPGNAAHFELRVYDSGLRKIKSKEGLCVDLKGIRFVIYTER